MNPDRKNWSQSKKKNYLFVIINLKMSNFVRNVPFLNNSESKSFATFKLPFATYGEWRMGWTTLVYRVFHTFGQAKFADGGSILGSSQLSQCNGTTTIGEY